MPASPTPFHLLRAHHAPLSALHFTRSNTHLFAGDQDGYVSVTDLSTRRVVAYWNAHDGGVLGVDEWEGGIISQGRDNIVHFHGPLAPTLGPSLAMGPASSLPPPEITQSLATNSLNFCRFSLAALDAPTALSRGKGKERAQSALLALPNLADSELIDIYHLPSLRRVHAAVNFIPRAAGTDLTSATRSGLVMSLHLQVLPLSPGQARSNKMHDTQSQAGAANTEEADSEDPTQRLALAVGYEDGRVELWSCPLSSLSSESWDARRSPNHIWERLWTGQAHKEAVMAMAVDSTFTRAFTVSADHLLCRIDLTSILDRSHIENDAGALSSYSTKQIGNGCIAVSADSLVVAVGGWDGRIRLFSAATFKPLGILSYHRESVNAISFARARAPHEDGGGGNGGGAASDEEDEDEDEDEDGVVDGAGPRERWLASAGKDRRVALWGLLDFTRSASS